MTNEVEKVLLSRSAMAKKIGVKVRQFDNLVAEGLPRVETPNGNRYEEAPCLEWYARFKDPSNRPTPANGNGRRREIDTEISALRLRRERLDLAKYEGTLVDVAFVETWQRSLLERLRSKMAPFPGKLAGKMIGLRTYGAALTAIKPAWDELLEELAQTGREIARDFGGDDGAVTRGTNGHAGARRRSRRGKS
jgi:hypothetical protein